MSNGLDPNLDRHSVGPDLGPKCLQRLSADDKKMQLAMKELITNLVTSAIVSLYLLVLLSSYPKNEPHKIY